METFSSWNEACIDILKSISSNETKDLQPSRHSFMYQRAVESTVRPTQASESKIGRGCVMISIWDEIHAMF